MIHCLWACLSLLIPPQQISNVHDGDTFSLYAVGVPQEEHIRILGVDTPELRDSLSKPAREAREFTRTWLAKGSFSLETCRRDSFGRYLAIVSRGSDTLATSLINAGLGVKR